MEETNSNSNQATNIEENSNNSNNPKGNKKGKGGLVIFLILLIVLGVGLYFSGFKNEKYVKDAVECLKSDSLSYVAVEEITTDGSKIIHYDGDTLVQLSVKVPILSYLGESQYVVTYSTNRDEIISTLEVEEMKYTEEWKNAKTEKIGYILIQRMNSQYFK